MECDHRHEYGGDDQQRQWDRGAESEATQHTAAAARLMPVGDKHRRARLDCLGYRRRRAVSEALVEKIVELATGQLVTVLAEEAALHGEPPQFGVDRLPIAHVHELRTTWRGRLEAM